MVFRSFQKASEFCFQEFWILARGRHGNRARDPGTDYSLEALVIGCFRKAHLTSLDSEGTSSPQTKAVKITGNQWEAELHIGEKIGSIFLKIPFVKKHKDVHRLMYKYKGPSIFSVPTFWTPSNHC